MTTKPALMSIVCSKDVTLPAVPEDLNQLRFNVMTAHDLM